MNKATTKAVELLQKSVDRTQIPFGLDLEKEICKLGSNVNPVELKKAVLTALALRNEEMANTAVNRIKMTLGL